MLTGGLLQARSLHTQPTPVLTGALLQALLMQLVAVEARARSHPRGHPPLFPLQRRVAETQPPLFPLQRRVAEAQSPRPLPAPNPPAQKAGLEQHHLLLLSVRRPRPSLLLLLPLQLLLLPLQLLLLLLLLTLLPLLLQRLQ